MKVNIEVQFLCTKVLRGIPYYILNLTEHLVARGRNDYSLSFFDYKRERENKVQLERYLKEATRRKIIFNECTSLRYDDIIKSNITGEKLEYMKWAYSESMNSDANIYHYTQSMYLPYNIKDKAVVTIHDVIPLLPDASKYCKERSIRAFKNNMNFLEENKSIQIISDSQSTKDDLIRYTYIDPERVHVVPLAFDSEKHYPERNEVALKDMNIDGPFLLYLGAIDFRKGIVDILDAYKKIKTQYKDIKLVLAGGMDPNILPVIEELKSYKYIDDVILTGFVTDDQKRILLSSAEAFLFPSEYEGFGLPVLEAMACGAPVITTDVSSLPEVGGDAAMYVTPKQPEELAAAIEKMLSSESVRQDYIARGFEQCKKFSWDKTAAMTEEVYKIAYNK